MVVADTWTGRRKQSSPSHILKKFTGTVTHDKGGGFCLCARVLDRRERNPMDNKAPRPRLHPEKRQKTCCSDREWKYGRRRPFELEC